MKRNLHPKKYMKATKRFSLFFISALMLSGCNCNKISETKYARENTKEQFSEILKSKQIKISSLSHKININDIENARKEVWHDWVETNKEYVEEKMPQIENIEKGLSYQWDLVDEDPMPFYMGSKGIKPQTGYPLFINLHGSGPKVKEWPTTLKLSQIYEDSPSLYFIPQIPNEKRYRWWYKPEQLAWEKLLRLALISEDIDHNKIYFMGISEGGYGSQRLGAFYADYLAGAGPMAGGEPLDNASPLNYRNIAFAFETGENDKGFGRNKLTLEAKNEFKRLSEEFPGEFIHNINLQSGKGHHIDYTRVTPWLINYKRNPHPKRVSWVNFPMHNRYRSGFYNLAVLEQFNIDAENSTDRTIFDMHITGNSITLQANTFDTKTRELGEITKGKLMIYLSPELVDLSKKVTVIVNGKQIHNSKLRLDKKHIINSCAIFGDPERLYPTGIEIDFNK